jgi:hypothetical protein
MNKKTITAIALNMVFPGTGYLYLKDPVRRPMAIFIAIVWGLFLVGALWSIFQYYTSNPYIFNTNNSIPILAALMYIAMIVDTYRLANKKK